MTVKTFENTRLGFRRIRGGGILRVLERGAGERGGFVNENAIEGEAPAVEQTRGKIGQASFTQVGLPSLAVAICLRFPLIM